MTQFATPFARTPFTTTMARDAGLARWDLDRLVEAELLRRVVRGVYVDASEPDSLELRAAALSLVIPEGVVVSLRTAAWLWGIRIVAFGAHLTVPPVDLTAPANRAAPRRSQVIGHSGQLLPTDLQQLESGIVVTTPLRTAVDVARLLSRPDALATLDGFLAHPAIDKAELTQEVERFAGHRGVVQARELTAFADARSESVMESRTRLRAHDAGFPPFEPQVEVFSEQGEFVARLDLARRKEQKGLEYDGDLAHGSRRHQQHDRRRRTRVERCGWAVAVVTGAEVNSRGLAFERGVAELLGVGYRLGPRHPSRGGWDVAAPEVRRGAA
jgi:hypothetical protein